MEYPFCFIPVCNMTYLYVFQVIILFQRHGKMICFFCSQTTKKTQFISFKYCNINVLWYIPPHEYQGDHIT